MACKISNTLLRTFLSNLFLVFEGFMRYKYLCVCTLLCLLKFIILNQYALSKIYLCVIKVKKYNKGFSFQ